MSDKSEETRAAPPQSLVEVLKVARYWFAAAVVPVRIVREQLLARIDAALASGNAATAARDSSDFSRGVREGLERAARLEKAARLLVGTYIRVTDPSWCGCCASHIGEGGGHRGDCEAAFMLRALAAQEGREPE